MTDEEEKRNRNPRSFLLFFSTRCRLISHMYTEQQHLNNQTLKHKVYARIHLDKISQMKWCFEFASVIFASRLENEKLLNLLPC